MTLEAWANNFNVSPEAVEALRVIWGIDYLNATEGEEGSEAGAQAEVRLEASKKGLRLWRNNVGAATMDDGSFVRYGLANESKKMNEKIKSSDLIGIRPVLITPDHVGQTIGQFVAREMKRPGWTYKGKGREVAQLKFIQIVHGLGGDARFATGAGTL